MKTFKFFSIAILIFALVHGVVSAQEPISDPESSEPISPLASLPFQSNTLYTATSNQLWTINPTTRISTFVGPINYVTTDIAFSGSILYGVSFTNLFSIDPTTGSATNIGSTGYSNVNALAVASDGTLYGVTLDGRLIIINKTTGAATSVGFFGPGLGSYGDIAFRDNGVLFAAVSRSGYSNSWLAKINRGTGVATLVGDIGFPDVWGLSFKDGLLYGVTAQGKIIKIGPSSGLGTLVYADSPSFWGLSTSGNQTSIDLEVTDIVASESAICAGSSLDFTAFIGNNGSQESGFFDIEWNIDGQISIGGHGSIPPGTTDGHGHFWENIPTGAHTLTFTADFNNSVAESNETNNQRSETFTAVDCTCGTSATSGSTEQPQRTPTLAPNMPLPNPMPLHPDLLERARRGEITLQAALADQHLQQQTGLNQPQHLAAPPQGDWKALALLVQFTDNPSQVGATDFDTLLFGGGFGTLTHYYNTVSYGRLNIVTVNLPSSNGWCNMPQAYSYYVNGQTGFGSYPQNAQKLAEDAVLLADSVVDFSQYDNDGDGYVDTVFIIHAGPGYEFTGNPDQIWSHSWETFNDPVVDGVTVNSYTAEPEYWLNPGDITVGVYAHELGHALGLPDLYDTDGSSHGVGIWSLMGAGSWNGSAPGGGSPAFLDAWSRAQLGFVTPTVITNNTTASSIPAAENSATVYRLWTDGSNGSEYFLVENRQRTSYDAALPGAGLLIWHIEENQPSNFAECRQLNNWLCGGNHYKVAVEQADGRLDLENSTSAGDTGDPYPGSTNDRSFTFTSSPNSSSYASSGDTYVRVTNISNAGTTMTANLEVRSSSLLLKNGSFEIDDNNDGKPDFWSTNAKFTRSSEITAVDGSFVGRFSATNNSGVTIQQVINNLTAGRIYNFSGLVNIPQTSDQFTFKIQVIWRNANNGNISTTTIKTYTASTNWNEAMASMVAPAGTRSALVKMVVTSLNGKIYVDRFKFFTP